MILKGKSLALERCFPDLIIFILISHELLFSDRERTSADLDDEGEAASEAKLQRTSSFNNIKYVFAHRQFFLQKYKDLPSTT